MAEDRMYKWDEEIAELISRGLDNGEISKVLRDHYSDLVVQDYIAGLREYLSRKPATKKPSLKLYVWQGVLCDWYDGVAFALARTPKEAVKCLIKDGLSPERFKGTMLEGVSPLIVRSPKGFHVYGGG